jgi:hypothetical protein
LFYTPTEFTPPTEWNENKLYLCEQYPKILNLWKEKTDTYPDLKNYIYYRVLGKRIDEAYDLILHRPYVSNDILEIHEKFLKEKSEIILLTSSSLTMYNIYDKTYIKKETKDFDNTYKFKHILDHKTHGWKKNLGSLLLDFRV